MELKTWIRKEMVGNNIVYEECFLPIITNLSWDRLLKITLNEVKKSGGKFAYDDE